MIRVDIVEEAKSPGVFRYRVPEMAIEGRSRQPLIDACRQIKSLVGSTKQRRDRSAPGRQMVLL